MCDSDDVYTPFLDMSQNCAQIFGNFKRSSNLQNPNFHTSS